MAMVRKRARDRVSAMGVCIGRVWVRALCRFWV
jgi:hypothetical protein